MKQKLLITTNGNAFSEFRGYETQQSVAPGWAVVVLTQPRRQS